MSTKKIFRLLVTIPCTMMFIVMPVDDASWAQRPGGAGPSGGGGVPGMQRPGGPGMQRPGATMMRGPGGPGMQRPGGQMMRGASGPGMQRPGGQMMRGAGGPGMQGPGGQMMRGPGGPGMQGPGGPGMQNPGGPGGGPGDQSDGGRPDFGELLRRMDSNQNGMIESDEALGPAAGMMERAGEKLGLKPGSPIPIDGVVGLMDERRSEADERRQQEQSAQSSSTSAAQAEPLVPGFGVESQLAMVPGFDLPADSPLLSKLPLEKRYDKRILERVEERMREYDKNGDGAIDKNEMGDGRWQGNPFEFDLDGDGRLNKVEMAERYADRYGDSVGEQLSLSKSSSTTNSSSPSSGSSSGGSSQDKLQSYAQSLLRQYDSNKNGSLDSDEFSRMSKPERYNLNGDNVITFDELAKGAASFAQSSSSGSSRSSSGGSRSIVASAGGDYRVTLAEDRLRKLGVPLSFILDDENQDGQLQMAEFSTTWTDEKMAEFQKYDINRDWVITPEEWLAAEKLERDKKK